MNILNFLEQKAKYMQLINSILESKDNQNIYVGNAACNLSRMLAALTYLKTNKNIVYIAENIYEADEPKDITSEVVNEKINISNKTIISMCCNTGTIDLAEAFVKKGNTYIAPSDFIEGTAALFFVIKFFYEHLVLNKSLIDAYNFSMQNDEETKLYKIFK